MYLNPFSEAQAIIFQFRYTAGEWMFFDREYPPIVNWTIEFRGSQIKDCAAIGFPSKETTATRNCSPKFVRIAERKI